MPRFDPLDKSELAKLDAAVGSLTWKLGAPVDPRYQTVLRAMRWLGAHPSCLAEPKKWEFTLKQEDGVWFAQWRRTKTKRWCIMPVPESLVVPLGEYLKNPYSRSTLWRIVSSAGKMAGLEGVGPRTLRHTRGYEVSSTRGPGTAKDSLGVSDSVLSQYTALGKKRAMLELAKDFQE